MSAASLMEWVVQTGLAVSILILFILLIRKPFARYFGAQATYALWLLPLARLFMPEITLPAIRQSVPQIVPDMSGFVVIKETPSPAADLTTSSFNIGLAFASLWFAIALLWLIFQIGKQHHFIKTLRKKSFSAPNSVGLIASRAAKRLRLNTLPELRISQDNSGPLVTGILRPVILLPKGFETRFTPTQQFFALTHEMAHIKRRDLWAALVALTFRAMNWPNPLVHIAARKFRADQEAACDAAVLKAMGSGAHHAHDYAETLVQAAKSTKNTGHIVPLGLTIHHPLKERLMTMTNHKPKTGLIPKAAVFTTLVTALALSTPLSMASGHPDETSMSDKGVKKQVIKIVEDKDGDRLEKEYEIITENGETQAYEIHSDGSKVKVDVKDIEAHNDVNMMEWHDGDMDGKHRIRIKRLETGDDGSVVVKGNEGKVLVKRMHKKMDGAHVGNGPHKEVVIKRMKKGDDGQVYAFSTDDEMEIHMDGGVYSFGNGGHTKIMVETASNLLDETMNSGDTDMLSSSTQRKLEKARKALKEASEALAAESK